MPLTKEQEEEFKQAGRVLEHVKPLLESEGWKILQQALENQKTFRERELLRMDPAKDMAEVFAGEVKKGEVRGLRLALSLAQGLVEMAEEAVKDLESVEDANGEEA